MNEKTRITFRIVAGGYLAYLGFDLIRNVIADKPGNEVLFGAAAVLFMGVGAGVLIKALRDYRNCREAEDEDMDKNEAQETIGAEDDKEDDEEEKSESEE